jgi:very-short-patch-repair endonuclease
MPKDQIVTKQHIQPQMQKRAVELRRNMTPAEQKLWLRLRGGRLEGFHFRRQQIIDAYIVDFYCHKSRLVVELDGSSHLDRQEYDLQRDKDLNPRGLRVLRFFNTDVNKDIETVLGVILAACREGEASTHP